MDADLLVLVGGIVATFVVALVIAIVITGKKRANERKKALEMEKMKEVEAQEKQRLQEVAEKKKADDARKRQEEDEKKRQEAERKKKAADEKKAKQAAERQRKEEEEQKARELKEVEERKRKEEQERERQRKKEEADAKRRAKEEEDKKRKEAEQKQKEEEAKRKQQEAEAQRQKEEEEKRKKVEAQKKEAAARKAEEARKAQEEAERKQKEAEEEQERKRQKEEEEKRKKVEAEKEAARKAEEARKAKEEAERKQKDAEEAAAKKAEEEQERKRQQEEEEKRKKVEAEMEAARKAEEARNAQEEAERKQKEAEEAAARKAEEEQERKRQQEEADAKRKEKERKAKEKADRKHQEEVEQKQKEEEDRKRKEVEQIQKEEAERRAEEEKLRQEEEKEKKRLADEEDRLFKIAEAEAARLREEAERERIRKEEEVRLLKEQEEAEARRLQEIEEQLRQLEEAERLKKQKEAEERQKQEEARLLREHEEAERKRQEEAEVERKAAEHREEAERQRKQEEEAEAKRQAEVARLEEERLAQQEAERLRVEEEAIRKREEDEAAAIRAAEYERQQLEAQEAAERLRLEEEALRHLKAEAAHQQRLEEERLAQQEAERLRLEEEANRKREEDEAIRQAELERQQLEERQEEARRKREEEEEVARAIRVAAERLEKERQAQELVEINRKRLEDEEEEMRRQNAEGREAEQISEVIASLDVTVIEDNDSEVGRTHTPRTLQVEGTASPIVATHHHHQAPEKALPPTPADAPVEFDPQPLRTTNKPNNPSPELERPTSGPASENSSPDDAKHRIRSKILNTDFARALHSKAEVIIKKTPRSARHSRSSSVEPTSGSESESELSESSFVQIGRDDDQEDEIKAAIHNIKSGADSLRKKWKQKKLDITAKTEEVKERRARSKSARGSASSQIEKPKRVIPDSRSLFDALDVSSSESPKMKRATSFTEKQSEPIQDPSIQAPLTDRSHKPALQRTERRMLFSATGDRSDTILSDLSRKARSRSVENKPPTNKGQRKSDQIYGRKDSMGGKEAGTFNIETHKIWKQQLDSNPIMLAKLIRAQSYARGFLARRVHHRLQCARELLETEKSYVNRLRIINEKFLEPSNGLITPQESAAIFTVIPELHALHSAFCHKLQVRISKWQVFAQKGVGDLFIKQDFRVLYSNYILNFEAAIKTLTQVRAENPALSKLIAENEMSPECEMQDIASLLIEPVQRLPRYSMLLEDLMRRSKGLTSTKQYDELHDALFKLKNVTNQINEQKKHKENLAYAKHLYDLFVFKQRKDKYFQPSEDRLFIKTGTVEVHSLLRRSEATKQLFLFNDALVLAEPKEAEKKKEKKIAKAAENTFIPMVGAPHLAKGSLYKVLQVIPLRQIQCVSASPSGASDFKIQQARSIKEKYHEFVAPTDTEASDWVAAIMAAVPNAPASRSDSSDSISRTGSSSSNSLLTRLAGVVDNHMHSTA